MSEHQIAPTVELRYDRGGTWIWIEDGIFVVVAQQKFSYLLFQGPTLALEREPLFLQPQVQQRRTWRLGSSVPCGKRSTDQPGCCCRSGVFEGGTGACFESVRIDVRAFQVSATNGVALCEVSTKHGELWGKVRSRKHEAYL